LTALAPAELDALTRARQAQQQVDKALRASAERELERKRYAVALAERQFNRVDPDNRLVAGELERRWEAALSELRAAEEGLARPPAEPARRTELGQDLNNKVVALFDSLPQIWASGTTTDAHRKALLRCLIEKVVLDRGERDIALARIVWRGGAVTELHVKMKVNSIAKLTHGEELRARLLDLARTGVPDDEIAETLTSEGYRSPDCVGPRKARVASDEIDIGHAREPGFVTSPGIENNFPRPCRNGRHINFHRTLDGEAELRPAACSVCGVGACD
jgi:hypothetical protein